MISNDQLSDWIGSWASKAKDYAHKPENYVTRGDSLEPHREHLRYKIRLEGWLSAMIFWYSVERDPQGRLWRHLSIQQSVHTIDPLEAITQADVNANKAEFLHQYTPIVKLVFPLHECVESAVQVHAPIPVGNPDTRQMTYRTPIVVHFLVRQDSSEHVLLGGRKTSGRLLDASGREIMTEPEIRNVADCVSNTAAAMQAKKPRGEVLPFQDAPPLNRQARRKAAREARKTKKGPDKPE